MNTSARIIRALFAFGFSTTADAQTNIDSTNKFSWTENCGWMNWRDAAALAGSRMRDSSDAWVASTCTGSK